jgi:dihydroneopterin aldolase
MKSIFYDQLFQLNRCLEQVSEILEYFEQQQLIQPQYAETRRRTVEDLRSDLSHLITGRFHQLELEACVGLAEEQIRSKAKVEADR